MQHNPDRIVIWPGYFNARSSRRSGRRVSADAAVAKPDLDGLVWAARTLGLKKMKREEGISHPQRPHAKEGRLWVSASAASGSIGSDKKEEILQMIGTQWSELLQQRKEDEKKASSIGPKVGDKQGRSQRKVSSAAKQAASRAASARERRGRKKWKK
jgi:signal recognition particle subunit SEC65